MQFLELWREILIIYFWRFMNVPLSLNSHFHCASDLIYDNHWEEEKEEGKGGEEGGRKGQKKENKYIKALDTRVLTVIF